ncbi:MAG: hypothetical protein HC828_15130 [Blastochloris sp.]|nr:hypothetical protein [Blastochloris sp.]
MPEWFPETAEQGHILIIPGGGVAGVAAGGQVGGQVAGQAGKKVLEELAKVCGAIGLGVLSAWLGNEIAEDLQTDVQPQENNDRKPTYLYHYTSVDRIQSIIASGLNPSVRDLNDPKSDAQWGDGQYLTDLTPEELSTVTRQQASAALFKSPWKWGAPPNALPQIGWIKIKVRGLSVQRVAPLFGQRFPQRSIYLIPGANALPLSSRVGGTGVVTFAPGPTGYR